jgi:hypothetical protein
MHKSKRYCVNCGQTELETPLLLLHYNNEEIFICPQCLPVMIHAPQKLTGKLVNAENIKPAVHQKY